MVKNSYGSNYNEFDVLAHALLSIGVALTLVSTLFFGIKFRWFRYRMTIPHEDSPALLRAQSVTEIRENCTIGQYRQSLQEDVMTRADNDSLQQTPSSSSYSVKSKSDRESIFRWPFKSKLSLSKSTSMREENPPRSVEFIRSTSAPESSRQNSDKVAHDIAIAEKNERIKRSIYERLHSTTSVSMPDLVQCDETRRSMPPPPPTISTAMTIQKGLEMSLEEESDEYHTIDEEVHEIEEKPLPKFSGAKFSVEAVNENVEEQEEEEVGEEEVEEKITQARPPTPPLRRRSRSNSIKNSLPQEESRESQEEVEPTPPPVMPRRKHVQASNTIEPEAKTTEIEAWEEREEIIVVGSRRQSIDIVPKSILKGSEASTHTNSSVHFINVPESSSSDEEYEDEHFSSISVWQQIDMHREQLTKTYQLNTDYDDDEYEDNDKLSSKVEIDDIPPPLPVTPPPRYKPEEEERDFSFA